MQKLLITSALIFSAMVLNQGVSATEGNKETKGTKGTTTVGALDNGAVKDLDKGGKALEKDLEKAGEELDKAGKTLEKDLDKAGEELDKAGKALEEEMKKNGHHEEKGVGSDSKAK